MERRGGGGDCSNQYSACVDLFRLCVCVCVSVSEVGWGGQRGSRWENALPNVPHPTTGKKSNFYSLMSLSLHPSFFPVPLLFP